MDIMEYWVIFASVNAGITISLLIHLAIEVGKLRETIKSLKK